MLLQKLNAEKAAKDELYLQQVLACNFQEVRYRLKLTQMEFADVLGCGQASTHNYLSGKSMPPLFRILRLCQAAGISLEQLVGLKGLKDE